MDGASPCPGSGKGARRSLFAGLTENFTESGAGSAGAL